MPTSPELKQFLADSIDPQRIPEEIETLPEQRRTAARERLAREETNIRTISAQLAELRAHAPTIDDTSFQHAARAIEEAIAAACDRVANAAEYVDWLNPVEWSEIHTLREFVDRRPMCWVPRKEDIGRLLTIAKRMHDARVARGEQSPDDPIRITDIGGANGAGLAAFAPPMLSKTEFPSTKGEHASPKNPFAAANWFFASIIQSFLPVAKSRQCNWPSAPRV
jgi:hypothetical protein